MLTRIHSTRLKETLLFLMPNLELDVLFKHENDPWLLALADNDLC